MANVLYYIPDLQQSYGGIRQYAKALLEIMAQDKTNKYFIYHNSNDPEILSVIKQHPELKIIHDEDVWIDYTKFSWKIKARISNFLYYKLRIGKPVFNLSVIDLFCKVYEIDIIHCPNQYIPKTDKVKLITTMHDVQELHYPKFFDAQTRAYRATGYLDYLTRASRIVVSYNHVKEDLVRYFQVTEDKISVLLVRMDNLWIKKYLGSNYKFESTDITGNFLLYPANTWEHKNHLNLIKALAILRNEKRLKIHLICTGHKTEFFKEIENLISELNISDQVEFRGVVSEEELYHLYRSCRGVVIPSLYEAGSFPLYESILLGVPVICSNVTSLPETIMNEDALFNPDDPGQIASKLLQMWINEGFREDCKRKLCSAKEKLYQNDPLPILQQIYAETMKISPSHPE